MVSYGMLMYGQLWFVVIWTVLACCTNESTFLLVDVEILLVCCCMTSVGVVLVFSRVSVGLLL